MKSISKARGVIKPCQLNRPQVSVMAELNGGVQILTPLMSGVSCLPNCQQPYQEVGNLNKLVSPFQYNQNGNLNFKGGKYETNRFRS